MRKLPVAVATLGLLALACGEGETPSAPAASAAPSSSAPAPAASPPSAAPAAAGKVDPLAGRSKKEICLDHGLAMIQWSWDDLRSNFDGLCCGPDALNGEDICQFDWPFSDVPTCDAYDYLRNQIYARYGYPFKDKQWQEAFGTQPWYKRREDFDASWLSPAASRNIERLKQLKKDKEGCM